MDSKNPTRARRLATAGLTTLLALPIGLLHAQTSPSGPPSPGALPAPPHGDGPHGAMRGAMHGPGGMHGMRDAERLRTSLRLDARQTALWDRAVERMKPAADQREQAKARRDRMTAMLDDPGFDPRKLAADMDGQQAERDVQHKAVRDAWIEVTIAEGRNRQVRRMTAAVGLPTLRLVRWRIGEWTVEGLGPGTWRDAPVPGRR